MASAADLGAIPGGVYLTGGGAEVASPRNFLLCSREERKVFRIMLTALEIQVGITCRFSWPDPPVLLAPPQRLIPRRGLSAKNFERLSIREPPSFPAKDCRARPRLTILCSRLLSPEIK